MNQSFKNFLLQYCQELTRSTTTSLKRLFALMSTNYPSAEEVLLVLALAQDQEDHLMQYVEGTKYKGRYQAILDSLKTQGGSLVDFLQSDSAPVRYQKVYNSYLAKTVKLENDRKSLVAIVDRTNSLLKETNMTRYKLAQELNLNKGNLYAFLKGDVTKMSRTAARRVWQYLYHLTLNTD